MSKTFTTVNDRVLCEVVGQARERLVFIAPGIRPMVAEALCQAMEIVPTNAIHLVLDVDAEVCRLGYGDKDFKGMERLQEAAAKYSLTVNHHPGIRIGLLIADETTLVYSPTPELIEAESRHQDKPNAIVLKNELPPQLANACAIGADGFKTLEVGLDQIDKRKVEEVKLDLERRPPKEFNIARIERVFSSLIQYVEWKIKDYKLASRTLKLRAELFGVRDEDVAKRLTNNYRLFSETDSLTIEIPFIGKDAKPVADKPKVKFDSHTIDRERLRIKKQFIIDAGQFGTLIQRRDVTAFENEIRILEAKITEYKNAIKELIELRVKAIVEELLSALHDRLKASPPGNWQSRFLGKDPSEDDLNRLFREDIQGEVDRVKTDFNPVITVVYKDVTYQTFKNPVFREFIEKRFGKKAIDGLLTEYDAAREQSQNNTSNILVP